MSLINNTTISVPLNENSQDTSCMYANSFSKEIFILCAYCFILLCSFIGNALIIIIFHKHRDLHKTVNYFTVNMAVSDLVLPLIIIPVQITELVSGSSGSLYWPVNGILGSIFCKLYYFTMEVSLLVSAQSLVWIAIDRFVAVVFPMKRGLISTSIRTTAIISTWLFGGLFYFPFLIILGLDENGSSTICAKVNKKLLFPSEEAGEIYYWLHLTFRFIFPLSLITVLYTAIAIALKRQSKALTETASNVQKHSFKRRRQAIQMAVVIVVLFYICVFPYALLRLISGKELSICTFQRPLYILTFFMWLSSALVNPIICLSFVESYRRGLRDILCPCSRGRRKKVKKREQITLKAVRN